MNIRRVYEKIIAAHLAKYRQMVFLSGPRQVGKTTLAKVIANTTSAEFMQLNATVAGKKDMEQVVEQAGRTLAMSGRRTILFIDEIHRFNKGQQDYLLPFVEDGTVILIGATTENPYFEVNGALISRSQIFELKPLSPDSVAELIRRAVYDETRGMGAYNAYIDDDAVEFLADMAGGDARHALNAVELGILSTEPDPDGRIHVTLDVASECIQRRVMRYDKDGDNHYDTISAFIKSMRGSDPDAAVYYLARMLEAGEDPKFIIRRIMICASEDVGMADPRAMEIAVAAYQACHFIGMPECSVHLTEAVVYMSLAPKSNAMDVAYNMARADALNMIAEPVPLVIRNAPTRLMRELNYGEGYQYAHDTEEKLTNMQCLPDSLLGKSYYRPTDEGLEVRYKERLRQIKEWKRRHGAKI